MPAKPQSILGLFDAISEELDTRSLKDRRDGALLLLGCAIGLAQQSGWSLSELSKLDAWPFVDTPETVAKKAEHARGVFEQFREFLVERERDR